MQGEVARLNKETRKNINNMNIRSLKNTTKQEAGTSDISGLLQSSRQQNTSNVLLLTNRAGDVCDRMEADRQSISYCSETDQHNLNFKPLNLRKREKNKNGHGEISTI